ncbi:MAG: deoxyribose-phosphate aldolase [Kiritimatiellae bacterium]|nr:deoxyribose-phosphate aldolase [Kiritimatiellia bacterium]
MASSRSHPDPAALAAIIDHTFLKASGAPADIERLCGEARQYGFGAVMVHPCEVERCLELLRGSAVKTGTVAGFPLGQNSSAVKDYEIRDALGRGAREIDMVMNVRALQAGADDYVRAEFAALASVCRDAGAVSKVILETCYLTDMEKRRASRLAVEAGVDFVKTSTGLAGGGATTADVRLMAAAVEGKALVKAAGGIRTLADALAMIAAGAARLGTSAGVAIMHECVSV